jgi:hypothetical protein
VSDPAFLTPPKLAARWQVKPSKVIAWIRSGELDAIDVSTRPGIGRPRYRISTEAIELFEARRAAGPVSTSSRPKRTKRPGRVFV